MKHGRNIQIPSAQVMIMSKKKKGKKNMWKKHYYFSFFETGQDNNVTEVGKSPIILEYPRPQEVQLACRFQSCAIAIQS